MTWCFTLTSVPELTPYPRPVRQVIVQRGLAAMRRDTRLTSWLPSILCICGVLLGVAAQLCVMSFLLLPVKPLPDAFAHTFTWYFAGVGIGGFAGGFLGMQLELRKLRPYLLQAAVDYLSEQTTLPPPA